MQFVRGQRAKISQLTDRTRRFNAEIVLQSARVPVFDFVCFGIDANGQLSDDRYMVFFNQKTSPDDAIALENLQDQKAKFRFDLDAVPAQITRLVFTVSVDGAGEMKDLGSGTFSLEEEGTLGPRTVLEYRFTGSDFQTETALMLAEIYRKDGEWRVWAQGQGFAGNLAALLKHFGGVEAEDSGSGTPSAASPTNQAAATPNIPTQPSPPVSNPAVLVSPPSLPVAPAKSGTLQQAIAQTIAGGTLSLARGEHQGPIYLDKPIILQGNGAVIWAANGPVVVVQSVGVTLQDIEVEATAPEEGVENSNVAVWVAPNSGPQLKNVRTRGEVVGVANAEGEWKLPVYLNLGEMAPRAINSFDLEIETPRDCEARTSISGVSIAPRQLTAGKHTVEIKVENIGADTFLSGNIEFSTDGIVRTVPISGHTALQACNPVKKTLIWSVDAAI